MRTCAKYCKFKLAGFTVLFRCMMNVDFIIVVDAKRRSDSADIYIIMEPTFTKDVFRMSGFK